MKMHGVLVSPRPRNKSEKVGRLETELDPTLLTFSKYSMARSFHPRERPATIVASMCTTVPSGTPNCPIMATSFPRALWSTGFCANSRADENPLTANMMKIVALIRPNDQLTDGGPSVTPEWPGGLAGPPFGEAPGSVYACNTNPVADSSNWSPFATSSSVSM